MTTSGESGKRWFFCLVLRFGRGRAIHWHWPRAGIVNCTNSADRD